MNPKALLTTTALLLAGLAAAAAPALAQNHGGRTGRMVQIFDTDQDQAVTVDEIKAEHNRLMGAADIDGDGVLSETEFRRRGMLFRRPSTTTLFDLLDANGDQKLSADEISAPSQRWFMRYDADDDGKLSAEELARFGKPPGHRGRSGHDRGPHGGGKGQKSEMRGDAPR